jgi:molecular chaperone DnaJ
LFLQPLLIKGDAKSTEKFKEASEAYEILSDDKKREMYDQFGHAGVDPNAGFGGGENPFAGGEFNFRDGGFHFSHGGPGDIDAEELFEAFFGGGRKGRRARGPRRGADLQMHTTLTFHEAVFGTTKTLKVRYQVMDNDTGRLEKKERDVSVDIPAGVDNGMNLRMEGQGADGDPGAQRGNLLITIIVKEDDYYQRDDMDVHTEIPISIVQALLGGTVDVKTLSGEVEMKIPKGCQPDTKLMLRGKGITRLHGKAKGNQIVHLKIQVPKSLTARQEELLREFDEETKASGNGISGKIAKAAGSVFEKVFGSGKKGKNESIKKGDDTDDDEPAQKKVAN